MVSDKEYLAELRKRLQTVMRKKTISKEQIAKEIGITLVTLRNFLNIKRDAAHVTTAKIENWLDKQ